MKKILLLFLLQGAVITGLFAQSKIQGKVKDASSLEPIEFATVMLKKTSDSTIAQSTFTDSLGHFSVEAAKGSYFLQVSFVAYQNSMTGPFSLDESTVDAGEITLNQNANVLSEVVIIGEKPAIERHADRMVMNISGNSIFKTSINALDVLKKAPGLRVNPDGTISLGNNITPKVFIDGKDVPMSSVELNNYLNTLEPDLIETIEIITSPSSRYDSQYKAIINIRLKRDKNLGLSGNFTSAYRQHRFGDLSNNLNLSYKTKKAAFTTALGYNFGKGFYQYDGIQNLFNDNSLDTYSDVVSKANSVPLRLGVDYFFNKNHSAGITYRYFDRKETKDNLTDNLLTEAGKTSLQKTNQFSKPVNDNNSVNAYYTGKFKNSTLDLLGTVAKYTSSEQQDIITREQQELLEQLKSGISSKINIVSSQLDFRTPLYKGNFEIGAKVALTETDNDVRFDILKEGGFEIDPLRTNHFIYKERILAGYFNYSGTYKKINYQAGLRAENTDSDARSQNNGASTLRNYTKWLPAASIGWKVDENSNLGLSYTSRLRRPNFDELNPFQFYVSPFTYAEGNPFLLPEITNILEFTYGFKNYGFSLKTGKTEDNIQQLPYYNPETFMTRYFRENLGKTVFHALGFNGANTIKKGWNVQYFTQISADNSYYFINDRAIDKYVVQSYVGGSQAFTLKNNWTLDNSFFYYISGGDAMYKVLPFWNLNFGIQKTMLNSNLVLKCNLEDVFNTGNQRIRSNSPEIIDTNFIQYYGARKVRFQLIYKFGKSTYKAKQSRRTDEENRAG